jgi:hypothetical protein
MRTLTGVLSSPSAPPMLMLGPKKPVRTLIVPGWGSGCGDEQAAKNKPTTDSAREEKVLFTACSIGRTEDFAKTILFPASLRVSAPEKPIRLWLY